MIILLKMPKKCYCEIETKKLTHVKICNLEKGIIFTLKEMENWQKEKYIEEGHEVLSVKCTVKKPEILIKHIENEKTN